MNPHKFIGIAQAVSAMSKDVSTKVGSVAVDDDGVILSVGFNGFPRGVVDAPDRLAERSIKLMLTAHSEANCIAQAARAGQKLYGSTLIVSGLFPRDVKLLAINQRQGIAQFAEITTDAAQPARPVVARADQIRWHLP